MPSMKAAMGKFEAGESLAGLSVLPMTLLKDALKFYFGAKLKGISSMKKMQLVEAVRKLIVVDGVTPAALPAPAAAIDNAIEEV